MIIQLRGTSGSGKSTAMRRIMEQLIAPYQPGWSPIYQPGRKQPLYYSMGGVVVLGHYESPCGGCDTIGSARQVYELITTLLEANPGLVVLAEGLLLSEDTKWSSQLPDLRVLFLSTEVDECIRRIYQRRSEAGNDKPLSENNTRRRVGVIERARIKLLESGVTVRRCSSFQAPSIVVRWLRKK